MVYYSVVSCEKLIHQHSAQNATTLPNVAIAKHSSNSSSLSKIMDKTTILNLFKLSMTKNLFGVILLCNSIVGALLYPTYDLDQIYFQWLLPCGTANYCRYPGQPNGQGECMVRPRPHTCSAVAIVGIQPVNTCFME